MNDLEIPIGLSRERLVRKWTSEVLEALAYGHSLGLHHNDFSWREVHLDESLGASLANFGRLTFDHEGRCPVRSCAAAAVEALSIGIAVFELLFDDDDDYDVASASARLRMPDRDADGLEVSSQARDFLRRLLVTDASHRLDVEGALRHPWVQPSVENFFADFEGKGKRPEERTPASSVFAKLSEYRRSSVAVTVALFVGLLVAGFLYYRRTDTVHPTMLHTIATYSKYLLQSMLVLLSLIHI